ncbi:MAG: hypothetical protein CSA29_02945 [Desulfobacterales bacterium]|nr:MAG: hypothetical protein CSA29_02945 [Desulfobacterales bacterium]
MIDSQQKEGSVRRSISLYDLLETIEQETLPALEADRQFEKNQSTEKIQQKVPYISFQIAGVKMMIPLASVAEVGYLPDVTALPHLPVWIRGIVQLQGEILPVIDLLTMFQVSQGHAFISSKSFLLLNWPDFKLCLEVEKISGTLNVDMHQETLMPLVQKEKDFFGGLAVYVQGRLRIGDGIVYLLNLAGVKDSPVLNDWKDAHHI